MDKFKKQLNNDLINDINEFNSKPEYAKIRELYKLHFNTIKGYIQMTNNKLAIEDISNLDSNLTQIISSNSLLLKEINKAILAEELTVDGINA